MILSKLAWSARPSSRAVRLICQPFRSRADTRIRRSASALSSWKFRPPAGGGDSPPSRISRGTCPGPMSSSSVAITIRSTTVPELPHVVPAPLVGHQQVERVGRDALLPNAEAGADAGQKLVHQRRDVGEPVAERGHPDQVHVEPVEQVLPEAPARRPPPRAPGWSPPRSGPRPGLVRLPPSRVSCRSSSTRSSLAWAARGSSPISSRNRVPRSADSKAPLRVLDRAGERAPLVAEELALDQALGQRGAVERRRRVPEGLGPSRCRSRATSSLPVPLSPMISTGLGIGATRAMVSRSALMAALLPTREVSPAELAPERQELAPKPAALQRGLDLLHHPRDRLGLVHEAVGAEPDRLHAALVVAGAGVDDHRNGGCPSAPGRAAPRSRPSPASRGRGSRSPPVRPRSAPAPWRRPGR